MNNSCKKKKQGIYTRKTEQVKLYYIYAPLNEFNQRCGKTKLRKFTSENSESTGSFVKVTLLLGYIYIKREGDRGTRGGAVG